MNLSAFTFFRFNDEIILSNEISNRPSSFWWKIPNRINLKRQMSSIWKNKSDQPMTILLHYNFVAGRSFAKDDVWKFSISLTWADLDTWSVHDDFDSLWGFKIEFVEYKSTSFWVKNLDCKRRFQWSYLVIKLNDSQPFPFCFQNLSRENETVFLVINYCKIILVCSILVEA